MVLPDVLENKIGMQLWQKLKNIRILILKSDPVFYDKIKLRFSQRI